MRNSHPAFHCICLLAIFVTSFIFMTVPSAISEDNRLNVVVTIDPLAFFVEHIGSDKVDIETIVPPGADPHSYEPVPDKIKAVSRAEVLVEMGSGIEFELEWSKKLEEMNRSMMVCDASKGIQLISSGEDAHGHGGDPHVWLSPLNAITIAGNVRDALCQADPENAAFYTTNAEALINNLKSLDTRLKKSLAVLRGKRFMVFHPAWRYFAEEFGLVEEAVEVMGKEPTARQMAGLIAEAKKDNIKVIFISPQFSSKSARVIADEIGGKVRVIDPMSRDYLRNLTHLADMLLEVHKSE